MINVMHSSIFPKTSAETQSIYRQWLFLNRPTHALHFSGIAIVIMLVLIPADYLLFPNGSFFAEISIVSAALFAANVLICRRFEKEVKFKDFQISISDRASKAIVFPGLYILFLYDGLLVETMNTPETYKIILIATYMALFFISLFLHKFAKEQNLVFGINLIALCLMYTKYNSIRIDILLLIIFQFTTAVYVFFLRGNFIRSMFNQYKYLLTFVPQKIAQLAAISPNGELVESMFEPTERFHVCLCCDWRGYQKLAKSHSSKEISHFFEQYYDIAFTELARLVPEGDYFSTWNADELFIIFYSENNDVKKVYKNALSFAIFHATETYRKINNNLSVKIDYDIGLASGIGLLGLVGSKNAKRTTAAGECGGVAKRLEREGKKQRIQAAQLGSQPILVMDADLRNAAVELNLIQEGELRSILPNTEDLEKVDYFIYSERFKH